MSNEALEYAQLELSFSPLVEVKEYFYPDFSLESFLSDVGGVLGLWLGVGALQLFDHLFEFSKIIKKKNPLENIGTLR